MAKETRTTPESTMQAITILASVAERMPDEVRTLHEAVVERLESGPKIDDPDGYAHIAQHLRDVAPLLMNEPRVKPALDRIVDEYMKASPQTAEPVEEIGPAAVAGLVVAATTAVVIGVVAIVQHCIVGPSPEPGQSLPTDC